MIDWSLDAFRAAELVGAIVVAVPPEGDFDLGADVQVVAGGATRAQSVSNALRAIETELVAIHDAARPLLTSDLVEDLVAALDRAADAVGVLAAIPVTDTIKESNRAFDVQGKPKEQLEVDRTVDRSKLWAAQTPQVFRTEALRAALEVDGATRDTATDESMLVEAVGGKVLIHPTPAANLKVTTPLDLKLAELLLAERSAPQ